MKELEKFRVMAFCLNVVEVTEVDGDSEQDTNPSKGKCSLIPVGSSDFSKEYGNCELYVKINVSTLIQSCVQHYLGQPNIEHQDSDQWHTCCVLRPLPQDPQ